MNNLLVLSCLMVVCLATTNGQFFSTATSRTTGRQGLTTGIGSRCVCSCCSGLLCKPIALRAFADSTCTTKACKDKCKVFEPKDCDHTFLGTNDAYCTL